MHCISTQQNYPMVNCLTNYVVIRLLLLDQYVAMLRAKGRDNDLIVKIAASELKKTVEMTN